MMSERYNLNSAHGIFFWFIVGCLFWASVYVVFSIMDNQEEPKPPVCRNEFGHRIECDESR